MNFDSQIEIRGDSNGCQNFSEVVPEKKSFNVNVKVSFADLVGKIFTVLNCEVFLSKFEGCKEFAVILLKSNGDEMITTTSSRVIMDQLAKIKQELPVKVHLEE